MEKWAGWKRRGIIYGGKGGEKNRREVKEG
jgi:hypothetical protein